ncbi:hypothetical protein CN692_12560 [Bacillus sp. AFS002410]|uniref:DUF6944 family repetitive protein n=1 Tax=Bacillus sp. AFS002410 TaxID=2033481 RepID=UPI000BEFFB0C|nr:hypothetical protein [Bacillus sp. AFS002410]PEJ57504.1 hypothetical protein CN692_12560 [Bacillus sp. AFS002410]
MDGESKSIVGSVIVSIGTITAAIGSTPTNYLKTSVRDDLSVIGNVLQATGNGIDAEADGTLLRAVGKEITASGNVVVFSGLILDLRKESSYKLFVVGNLLQALGLGVNVGEAIELTPFPGQSENIVGSITQIIGNTMQAIGWSEALESIRENENKQKKFGYFYDDHLESSDDQSESELLVATGSWIQAIGSVISVIGAIKEGTEAN